MNRLTLVLISASVAANALLLAAVLRERGWTTAAQPGAKAPVAGDTPAPAPSAPDEPFSPADRAALERSRDLLAMDDLPALVAQLRAAGFPPSVIRGIISARVADRFGARRKAAVARLKVVPYWQGLSSFPHNPRAGAEVTRLFREQTRELKRLLGPDYYAGDPWSEMLEQRQYGYLPPGKVDALKSILDDYRDMQNEVMGEANGLLSDADRSRLELITQERRRDIESLLTAGELAAYDLREDPIATGLRFRLQAFQPTEDEFASLYRLMKTANASHPEPNGGVVANGSLSPADLAAALGPERAAEYRMKTSGDYATLDRLRTRFHLSEEDVAQAYLSARSFQQRLHALDLDPSLDPEARHRATASLLGEAQTDFEARLGTEAYGIYRQYSGWLNQPVPAQPAPHAAPTPAVQPAP